MSNVRMLLLSILTLVCTINIPAQNISILVYVHDHYTHIPLDSALVKIIRDGIVIDSSYTAADGRTELTITPTEVEERQLGVPNTFSISENYPNPFRDETSVEFSIPESQTIRADVYNVLGQHLLSDEFVLSAGNYTLKLPFSNLPTGIYFLRVRGMEQQVVKLMKVGGDVHYEGKLARGSMQVTPRSGTSLPLKKITGQDVGYTIQVEKKRYETWSVMRQIDSDTEITVPLVMLAKYLLTDIDGNVYQTTMIGHQWWMVENLRVTRYRNGEEIPQVTDASEWGKSYSPQWTYFGNDLSNNNKYGKLYNWYAVDDPRGLCPEGWNIPNEDDWQILIHYLGGKDVAGGKLKSTRTEPSSHPRWRSPNIGANNKTGFSAFPGGSRHSNGAFSDIGNYGHWWSSTEGDGDGAFTRSLNYNYRRISRYYANKLFGFSVRCVITKGTKTYSISGEVTQEGEGLAGVTIIVSGEHIATAQTDADGSYSIAGIPENSNVTVTPSRTGYSFSPSSRTIIGISSNETNQDFMATIENESGTITDIDGNSYKIMKIDNQWWMAENLRVMRYRNGEEIPHITDPSEWSRGNLPRWAYYGNESSNNDKYGKLYNWYTVVDSRGICPEGWHIPSDDDWQILIDYLGGKDIAGGKLKSTRTEPHSHPRWNLPNVGATNESGFSGLPGGGIGSWGISNDIGKYGHWWSSTEGDGYGDTNGAWTRSLNHNYEYVSRYYAAKQYGFSVRCKAKDNP